MKRIIKCINYVIMDSVFCDGWMCSQFVCSLGTHNSIVCERFLELMLPLLIPYMVPGGPRSSRFFSGKIPPGRDSRPAEMPRRADFVLFPSLRHLPNFLLYLYLYFYKYMYLYLYLYLYLCTCTCTCTYTCTCTTKAPYASCQTLFSQSRACKQHKVGLYVFINIWLISSHRCPV